VQSQLNLQHDSCTKLAKMNETDILDSQ